MKNIFNKRNTSWYLQYESSPHLTIDDKLFLSRFKTEEDFTNYCIGKFGLTKLYNSHKLTIVKVLDELRNG